MTEENQRLLEKLYLQYKESVKPLLAEIEAVYEKFPLALYNEIRALNDHVARAFTADDDEKAYKQIEKAYNHLNRIIRDCYKFLNLYYRREAESFDKKLMQLDPRTNEEYKLMVEYGQLSDKATELVEYAKQNEHLVPNEETYRNFENSYNAYKDLHRFIVKKRREVFAVSKKRNIEKLLTVALSVVTFILGCIITNNNQAIIDFFKNFF